MRRSTFLSSLALGLVLASSGLPAQQGFDLKRNLPPQTLLYASFPDLTRSAREFQSMPLGKLFQEEEVQEFLAQPLQFAKAYLAQAKVKWKAAYDQGMVPLSFEDVMALRPGNASFALVGPGGPGEPVRFVFTLGFHGNEAVLDKLVQFVVGKFQEQIQAYQKMGVDQEKLPKLARVAGAQAFVVDTTNMQGPFRSITLAYKKGLFLLASSKALAEQVLGAAPKASLAVEPLFHSTFAKLKSQDPEALFFCRPRAMLETLLQFLPKVLPSNPKTEEFLRRLPNIRAALDASGLLGCRAFGLLANYEGGKCYWDGFLDAPAPRKGFLNLGGNRPVNLDHLAWIPKKASQFQMGTLPIRGLFRTVMDILHKVDPDLGGFVDAYLDSFRKKLGFDIQKDFLDQFGGEFLSYGFISTNLMAGPRGVFITQVKDPDTFLNSLETLLGFFKGAITLEKRKDPAAGLDIWEVQVDVSQLPPDKAMILGQIFTVMKPSFTFQKGYLVVAFNPRDLKSAVARMQETPKTDIRSNEEVARFLKSLPAEVTSLSFNDLKRQIQTSYEFASGMINMLSLPEDIPVDLALLPGSDTVAKYLFPSVSYSVKTKDGFFSRTVSPFGPEVVVGLAAVGAGVAGWVAHMKAVTAASTGRRQPKGGKAVVVPLPIQKGKAPVRPKARPKAAPPGGATPAQKRRVQEDFDILSSGLVIYKVENGTYPDTLNTLLKPTQDYPRGFLPDWTSLPKDPWGHPYRYQRTPTGYKLWSVGPNGKDEGGKGDDILRAR